MILLLGKVTLLFSLALGGQAILRHSSAAIRHLICACALCGALLLPLTVLAPPSAGIFHIETISFDVHGTGSSNQPLLWPSWTGMAVVIWTAGCAILATRIALGYLAVARLVKTAVPLGVRVATPVLLADVSVPLVAGLLKPVILLPRSAAGWPGWQLDADLNHELQHVRRKDLWTLLAGHLACALWFHPLAWAVSSRLRHEQESACDDAVLAAGFDPGLLRGNACRRRASSEHNRPHWMSHAYNEYTETKNRAPVR